MELLAYLIALPVAAALLLLVVRADKARSIIVCVAAAAIAAGSIALAIMRAGAPWEGFAIAPELADAMDILALCISIALTGIIVSFAVRHRSVPALVLAIVQFVGSLYFELACAHPIAVALPLSIDPLSVIMALIIGVIGSGICVYALGYMRDFQAHEPQGATDRRPVFFALMFLFLSAMYVIVFTNNMSWMFTGWEVTTVCSFLLIGYTRTDEAIRNAFRQIIMNMLGGIGFLAALIVSARALGTLSFDEFIAIGVSGAADAHLMAFATCALAFAGLTKSAQMPFHTWLLGAMVAPTPTSALLHSSTMVKAGVFLVIKLVPLFALQSFIVPKAMVLLVGGLTFLFCSFMAISQSNAKRVLAYSTIANLGLIVMCAGIGTAAALWAAILLTIFHAASKSLLFLCVGTAEHHIGSRDIEDMDLLFERMPRLARFMMLGIMCMFIAPFGMLTAKWATLASLAETGNVILIILLAFGSAATFMFWAKWLGKLSGIAGHPDNIEGSVHRSEWASLGCMAGLSVAACVLLPFLSACFVAPAIQGIFAPFGAQAAPWLDANLLSVISDDELWIAAVLAILIVVVIAASARAQHKRNATVYLAGVGTDSDRRLFRNSRQGQTQATARNLYLTQLFGEDRLNTFSTTLCAAIIVIALAASGLFVPPII